MRRCAPFPYHCPHISELKALHVDLIECQKDHDWSLAAAAYRGQGPYKEFAALLVQHANAVWTHEFLTSQLCSTSDRRSLKRWLHTVPGPKPCECAPTATSKAQSEKSVGSINQSNHYLGIQCACSLVSEPLYDSAAAVVQAFSGPVAALTQALIYRGGTTLPWCTIAQRPCASLRPYGRTLS